MVAAEFMRTLFPSHWLKLLVSLMGTYSRGDQPLAIWKPSALLGPLKRNPGLAEAIGGRVPFGTFHTSLSLSKTTLCLPLSWDEQTLKRWKTRSQRLRQAFS